MATTSTKVYPKKRPKPLYAYISQGAKRFAEKEGAITFGSISAYVDNVIQRDMAAFKPKRKTARNKK